MEACVHASWLIKFRTRVPTFIKIYFSMFDRQSLIFSDHAISEEDRVGHFASASLHFCDKFVKSEWEKRERRFFNLRSLSVPCEKFHSSTLSTYMVVGEVSDGAFVKLRVYFFFFCRAAGPALIFVLWYWFNLRLKKISKKFARDISYPVHFHDRPFARARKKENEKE